MLVKAVSLSKSNAYVYEFPAGLVEPGEEMAQAGIREIYEETGLFRAKGYRRCIHKTSFLRQSV